MYNNYQITADNNIQLTINNFNETPSKENKEELDGQMNYLFKRMVEFQKNIETKSLESSVTTITPSTSKTSVAGSTNQQALFQQEVIDVLSDDDVDPTDANFEKSSSSDSFEEDPFFHPEAPVPLTQEPLNTEEKGNKQINILSSTVTSKNSTISSSQQTPMQPNVFSSQTNIPMPQNIHTIPPSIYTQAVSRPILADIVNTQSPINAIPIELPAQIPLFTNNPVHTPFPQQIAPYNFLQTQRIAPQQAPVYGTSPLLYTQQNVARPIPPTIFPTQIAMRAIPASLPSQQMPSFTNHSISTPAPQQIIPQTINRTQINPQITIPQQTFLHNFMQSNTTQPFQPNIPLMSREQYEEATKKILRSYNNNRRTPRKVITVQSPLENLPSFKKNPVHKNIPGQDTFTDFLEKGRLYSYEDFLVLFNIEPTVLTKRALSNRLCSLAQKNKLVKVGYLYKLPES